MFRLLLILAATCFYIIVPAQEPWRHGRLQVSPNGHYLQYADGTPFFWLGDTAWELFHRLRLDQIKTYLDNRHKKGFNVIQALALAEFDGLRKANQYGDLPLHKLDPAQPNENYFRIIDSTIVMARDRGLFLGLLPTWGDKVTKLWGEGPVVFDSVNAYQYGKWLGNRYKKYPNLIWILGGDRPARVKDSIDYRPVWRQMARGIRESTKDQCLITYHPWGGLQSSSQDIHQEPWLDLNMFQSGHGSGPDVANWDMVRRDRAYQPVKPTLDAEPNYEDHPVNPWPKWDPANGYYRDYDVRKQSYRSVFAGACGVTYGHHAVWQFWSKREININHADRYWTDAINRPGATQVGYLRRLVSSRPMKLRVPDSLLVLSGQDNKGGHIEAYRGADNSYAMIYLPVGKLVTIQTGILKGRQFKAWWFNPKNAATQLIGTFKHQSTRSFMPPTMGPGNDWVLVLDDLARSYRAPGNKR